MKKPVLILMILLMLAVLAVPAFAAEVTQDGLSVSLTAKPEGANITAALTLTNQSDAVIQNIELEPMIPDGYALESEAATVDILEPGQSCSLSLRYITQTNPATGDISLWFWCTVLIWASALLIFCSKPLAKRMLCMLLCAALLLGGIGIAMPAQAAWDSALTVTETVTVDNRQMELMVAVRYLIDVPETDTDSDGDGVADQRELELGTDPNAADASFAVRQSDGIASVVMELTGEQVDTLTVKPAGIQSLFPEDIPGYMGQAYDFQVEGSFDSADISFRFDQEQFGENAQPVIYYFNEATQTLEALDTRVERGVATATVEHFSTYILIDRTVYDGSFTWVDVWDNTGT